jgi:hypothetical protein
MVLWYYGKRQMPPVIIGEREGRICPTESKQVAFKPASRLKLVALGIIAYGALASLSLEFLKTEPGIIVGHFPAIIGLPMAAAGFHHCHAKPRSATTPLAAAWFA